MVFLKIRQYNGLWIAWSKALESFVKLMSKNSISGYADSNSLLRIICKNHATSLRTGKILIGPITKPDSHEGQLRLACWYNSFLEIQYACMNTSEHKVHTVCPLVRIGTAPSPLTQASVSPPGTKGGGERESQFGRLEKKHGTLSTLCSGA